jgi:hypothetical protein
MLRWVRRLTKDGRDDQELSVMRREHWRVLRKAETKLPNDDMIRAAVVRAERALRGEREGYG